MEFNTNGTVDRYFNLDEILKLDLDAEVRQNMEEKFGRTVFFDSNGSCKMGKLIGLEKNYKLSMVYYIVQDLEGKRMFVPVNYSITPV